jgi:CHAD domain-containing protein
MADGKWISELSVDMPVAEAARRVLAVRLRVVRERLPLALTEADKDPEHVHQLRVGTRRARAALEIFSLCLPRKTRKRAAKCLKQIRRAAGAARDWDVFKETLTVRLLRARMDHRPGLDFLLGYGTGQRAAAQETLEQTGGLAQADLDELVPDTLAAVRDPDAPDIRTLQDLARPMLLRLVHELETAAGGDLKEYEHLHQVRILGKQLRYAMEVFESCFADPYRDEYYPAVEQMQEILGRANDSYVAAQRLECLRARLMAERPRQWKRYQPGIDGLVRYHKRRLPMERRRFLQWWAGWLKAGAEGAFAALIMGRNGAETSDGSLSLSGQAN